MCDHPLHIAKQPEFTSPKGPSTNCGSAFDKVPRFAIDDERPN
jgi:hypothetical protein